MLPATYVPLGRGCQLGTAFAAEAVASAALAASLLEAHCLLGLQAHQQTWRAGMQGPLMLRSVGVCFCALVAGVCSLGAEHAVCLADVCYL